MQKVMQSLNDYIELIRCVLQTMKGGHYMIGRKLQTFSCNYGIIVLIKAKISLSFIHAIYSNTHTTIP